MHDRIAPELIAATEKALDEHGWNGLTATLIAEAAGINRVTLHRRNHTVASLLAAAAARVADEFKHATLDALTGGDTAADRLTAVLDALYCLADEHLSLVAGLYDGPTAVFHLGGNPDQGEQLTTRFEYTEPFERLLRDGNLDGSLHSKNPQEDAELIFNTAGWTYVHLRRSHGWPPDRARAAVMKVALSFVVTDATRIDPAPAPSRGVGPKH